MTIQFEQLRAVRLSNEAGVIQNAAHHEAEVAVAVAQAVIDGTVNGMIRLHGAEPTAGFLFTVADRAAGGVRQPTAYVGALPSPPFDPGPLKLKPAPWWERLTYATGFVQGAWVVILVLIVMGRLR